MSIRMATSEDAEAIAWIIRDSFRPHEAGHVASDIPIFEPANHRQAMQDVDTRWALACEDGRPVGVAMWRMIPGMAHLHLLFVAGDYQGKGYAKQLIRHHQGEARREDRRLQVFTLHCLHESLWAMDFYRRRGYTQYDVGDERVVPALNIWIESCKRFRTWPLPARKALFFLEA